MVALHSIKLTRFGRRSDANKADMITALVYFSCNSRITYKILHLPGRRDAEADESTVSLGSSPNSKK